MEINKYLQKYNWERRLPLKPYKQTGRRSTGASKREMEFDNNPYQILTQSDFLNELYPTSHGINLLDITSLRPKLKFDKEKNKHEFDGYFDQYRTSMPLQYGIRRNKAHIAFANDIWFGKEGYGKVTDEIMSEIKREYNLTNMTNQVLKMGYSLLGTGDAAIVCYVDKDKNKIVTKTYSYEKGDVLNYIVNPYTGVEVGVRMFKFYGRKAVELWKNETLELWIDDIGISKEDPTLADLGFNKVYERSEDGFAKVIEQTHGLTESPFVYFRAKDVCWGVAQQNIEDVEKLVSDILEAGKLSFFPIAFFKGGIVSLPPMSNPIKTIGSKGENGDGKFMEPPAISSSITFAYEELMTAINDGSGNVVLHSDELKGQNDSGVYIENLYRPAIVSATETYAEQSENFEKLIRVFKTCVGLKNGNVLDYESYEMSYKLIPHVPKSEAAEADVLSKYVGAGILSIKTAVEENDRSNPDEYNRIQQEKRANESNFDEKIIVEQE